MTGVQMPSWNLQYWDTEQMQIIRCCHMKNYFNLKEYLVCILHWEFLQTWKEALHWEFLQPWRGSLAPPGWCKEEHLGCWVLVLWHWIETKSSSWAEDLMDTRGLIDIFGVSARAELWRLQSLEQLVIKHWKLLKGKYLVKDLWSHLRWAFSLFYN